MAPRAAPCGQAELHSHGHSKVTLKILAGYSDQFRGLYSSPGFLSFRCSHPGSFNVIWLTMTKPRQHGPARLRALLAVAIMLCGFAYAPIGLASASPDVCAMVCCVEEGHCCCTPRRASVKGQTPGDSPALSQSEIVSPCPEGCTNSTTPFKLATKQALRPASRLVDLSAPAVTRLERRLGAHLYIGLSSASPRAPPLL